MHVSTKRAAAPLVHVSTAMHAAACAVSEAMLYIDVLHWVHLTALITL
jgi:hypothetical protein